MEYTTVSRSGNSATNSFVRDEKDMRIYEPLKPNEISKITATPTSPPPSDDLPSYPAVPFLLHPHRPLLLWCSSSAVHAYDFVNNRWEAGGPQLLQAHLQQLHHLPIAAADCICLECGARSSALRDSTRLNKLHTRMRRFLSQSDSCPSSKDVPDHSSSPAVRPPNNAGAAEFDGSHTNDAAGKDAAGAVDSDDVRWAGGDPTAVSISSQIANTTRRGSAGCVWVTAGEDKYLHFVEVGSYKLLRSRLQRKKLSSVVFLSSVNRPPAAASCATLREHLTAGANTDRRLHGEKEAVPVACSSRSPTEEPQQRPAVQLLVADKFGDVYLLRDCLGAPTEQSLAGDLLSERMRKLPSVHGVRVSAASGTGESLCSDASSDIPGTLAVTRRSASSRCDAAAAQSLDGEPSAAGESVTADMNCSPAPTGSASAHLSAGHTACGRHTTNKSVEGMRPRGRESSCVPVSGQETHSWKAVASVGGGVAAAGEGAAAAGTVPVSEEQTGESGEEADEKKGLDASVAFHEDGDDISSSLLRGVMEEDGETEQREGGVGGSIDSALATPRVLNHAFGSETVTFLRPAAPSTAEPDCDGAGVKASTRVCTATISSADPAVTDVPLSDVRDAHQLLATRRQQDADRGATHPPETGERGAPAELQMHQKPEWPQERHEEQQEGRQQTQQQTGQQECVLKQRREGEEHPLNTREMRSRENAWQRERARLWRQQLLSTTGTPAQHLEPKGSDWNVTMGAGPHGHAEENASEDSCAGVFADIPLLSHLTTITVMKVFSRSSPPSDTFKDAGVAAAVATSQHDAVAASEHPGNSTRQRGARTGCEDCPAAPINIASAFGSSRDVSSALCSSRYGASHHCLHTSVPATVCEEATGCVSQRHVSDKGLCRTDLLLTADRDEKVRVCFLEQPWSIESFYLGHSEFVVDCLLIVDECAHEQREGSPLSGDCSSHSTKEGLLLVQDERMSGSGTAHICQPTRNYDSVMGSTGDAESSSRAETARTACLLEGIADRKLHSRQNALLGNLGISAAADGTLQAWRVSDGAQVDELLLVLDALFESRDLSLVLSCYEEAPPTGGGAVSLDTASRLTVNREDKDLCSKSIGKPQTVASVPPPLLSHVRLLPSSLLFDEYQRLLVVQCLKLRGLLLIPVERRQLAAPDSSGVRPCNPLLRRHPFFIPFPAVPVAVLPVYHSLEELDQAPALAQAARALRPLLSPKTVTRTTERRTNEQHSHRPRGVCSVDATSSDACCLQEHSPTLASTDYADERGFYTVPGAVPFVWWIDEKGRLRPPVCVSVLLLQRKQHSHLQEDFQHAEAGRGGLPAPISSHILPCVEGCSCDTLGTDYGINAARTNSVYFWKRTRSSTCPTQAERAERRLRHKHLQQQQQSQGSTAV